MNEITIPKKLQPIVNAFYAESKEVAKALILQAAKAIYNLDAGDDPFYIGRDKKITDDELNGVCALMEAIKPRDMLEALFAAQIVVSHMLGMRKLAQGGTEESRIGLKMLRFSNEALSHLQKKRSGGMQNITVNYNYNGMPAPLISTIPIELKD
jgi:hypothetical protein